MIHNCPICGVNVDKMSDYDYGFHIIDCQEKRIAELENPILCAKCNDHIIADDGAVCEICADTQDTIITELQTRIAELEQELKNQVELHNEWLGTYRIKLDYIEELERKIKRLTT